MKNPLTTYAKALLKERSGFIVERPGDGSRYYVGCPYYGLSVPAYMYDEIRVVSGLFPILEPGTRARSNSRGEIPGVTPIDGAGMFPAIMDAIPDTYTPATDWKTTMELDSGSVAVLTSAKSPIFVNSAYWALLRDVCPDRYRGGRATNSVYLGNPGVDSIYGVVCPVNNGPARDRLEALAAAMEALRA